MSLFATQSRKYAALLKCDELGGAAAGRL